GGYACDPTSEDPNARCEFDAEAYKQARKDGKTQTEAINAGLHSVCPVCYLFGATGWARQFQLRAVAVSTTPLHFRTTLSMNASWLKRVFGGERQNIDSLSVPYGELRFQFIARRHAVEFAKNQLALVLHIAAEYGGIGARMQHGFGQFVFPPELNGVSLECGLEQLKAKISEGILRSKGPAVDTPFTISNFVSLTFEVPKDTLSAFTQAKAIGASQKKEDESYIPCAFDLRYKGKGNWGMRQWLKSKDWEETSDPRNLEELDLLLGPRSQWGRGNSQQQIDDEFRTASRVFFGMPYQKQADKNTYVLRIWAFWSPELRSRLTNVDALENLLQEYIQHAFYGRAKLVSSVSGKGILAQEA
ncbi:MAG: hypothetical protein WHV66_15290, partial [Anaerolineales bacterium]